ncbi:MAG: SH3 domain-containing protein [Eubacterium sp.]|nr:SH3 domain-containing protein [Eubacterium sp.]
MNDNMKNTRDPRDSRNHRNAENQRNGKKKQSFFGKMLRSENPKFEITMFTVSIAVALAVLFATIWVGYYYIKGQTGRFSSEEVNANSVTGTSVEVEEKEPVDTPVPSGDTFVNEDDFNDVDEGLKTADIAYTTSDVNLREQPSLTATVLAKVPYGKKVDMVSFDGKEWAKVIYNGTTGYINAMYLSTSKPVPQETLPPVATATPKPKAKATATPEVTKAPKVTKTPKPTKAPTATPTEKPTEEPTEAPTEEPEEPDDEE